MENSTNFVSTEDEKNLPFLLLDTHIFFLDAVRRLWNGGNMWNKSMYSIMILDVGGTTFADDIPIDVILHFVWAWLAHYLYY